MSGDGGRPARLNGSLEKVSLRRSPGGGKKVILSSIVASSEESAGFALGERLRCSSNSEGSQCTKRRRGRGKSHRRRGQRCQEGALGPGGTETFNLNEGDASTRLSAEDLAVL